MVSESAAHSPKDAACYARRWIEHLQPAVVVTEKTEKAVSKGKKTKAIVCAIANEAAQHHVLDVSVARPHDYSNKYEEAADLARRYPDTLPWLPGKRRFFDNEPRNTVLFEALSLAEAVMRGPSTKLAAAMG